ncbi:MAG: hypothetical protein IAE86_19890 [Burkholderiaceae bacterium]|nr:hypothetical protein [Burkholderiaceae bacterium]
MGQETGLISQKEVLQRVLQRDLNQLAASALLRLSLRKVKRLCKRLHEQGAGGSISRQQRRPSNRRVPETRTTLSREHYTDSGPELERKYLVREHGYAWSTETLRGCMIQAELSHPKRHRAQRVRSPREWV